MLKKFFKLFNLLGKNHLEFTGPYESWQEAGSNSSGYDSDIVIKKVKEATQQVLLGDKKYERDGTAFDSTPENNTLINLLQKYGISEKKIVDVGGGLGSLYINSSDNSHLAGQELPKNLQSLVDYGMPISPGLAGNVTGKNMGQANIGAAFSMKGGGALPSLQTLNNQPGDETELIRGYAEGVTGMPWQNVLDYIGRPTQMLGSASRSRLAG